MILGLIGSILTVGGSIMWYYNIPDNSYSIFVGPLIIALSMLLGFKGKESDRKSELVVLSSRTSFTYKFLVPFFVVIFIFLVNYFLWPRLVGSDKILFSLFFSVLGLFAIAPLAILKEVYYTDDFIFIGNFFSGKTISFEYVVEVERFMIIFYSIKYRDAEKTRRIFFLSRLTDLILFFGGEPERIVKLKKIIHTKQI